MFTRLKNVLAALRGQPMTSSLQFTSSRDVRDVRGMPGQAAEKARYLYAQGPDAVNHLVQYAMDAWVFTAVSELATDFASAPIEVWHRGRPQKAETHAILDLLGPAGRPNADQDLFEFLEQHISNLLLCGNSYWYWHSPNGGAPTEVYNLPPEVMAVVPGGSDVVASYVLRWMGQEVALPKENVTHYKKYHPFSRYYGLSALEALRVEIQSDRSMANWNAQFFGDDVFAPAGILVVDETVSDKEKERIEEDLAGKHGPRRRTAVMRGKPGSTQWIEAGLKHHDLDFQSGRLLSRQAVYEALGLPLGLYSESSTEAHARVAERLKLNNVWKLHKRTAVKINQDALPFWPGWAGYDARFSDVRKVDWQMEKMKLDALRGLLTVNEIRERHLEMAGIAGGEKLSQPMAFGGARPGQPGQQKPGQPGEQKPEADNADNSEES